MMEVSVCSELVQRHLTRLHSSASASGVHGKYVLQSWALGGLGRIAELNEALLSVAPCDRPDYKNFPEINIKENRD